MTAMLDRRIDPHLGDRSQFLHGYLKWAKEQRENALLLHAEQSRDMEATLAALISAPPALAKWANAFSGVPTSVHRDCWTFVVREQNRVSNSNTEALKQLSGDLNDGRICKLPWDGSPLSRIITNEIFNLLSPAGPRPDAEIMNFDRTLQFALAGVTGSEATIDPYALNLGTREALIRIFAGLIKAREELQLWWPADALHKLAAKLVYMAYAEGVRHSLNYLSIRNRSRLETFARPRIPMVLIDAPPSGLQRLTVAWPVGSFC